jgi:hypothetical protein
MDVVRTPGTWKRRMRTTGRKKTRRIGPRLHTLVKKPIRQSVLGSIPRKGAPDIGI